jgi:hypothetical protein
MEPITKKEHKPIWRNLLFLYIFVSLLSTVLFIEPYNNKMAINRYLISLGGLAIAFIVFIIAWEFLHHIGFSLYKDVEERGNKTKVTIIFKRILRLFFGYFLIISFVYSFFISMGLKTYKLFNLFNVIEIALFFIIIPIMIILDALLFSNKKLKKSAKPNQIA